MNRRTFLGVVTLGGGLAIVGLSNVETKFDYCEPVDLFEAVEFPPGTLAEFPLDFLHPNPRSIQVGSVGQASVMVQQSPDYVHVPTFDLGASGGTVEQSESEFQLRLNSHAATLLIATAGHYGHNVEQGAEEEVRERIVASLESNNSLVRPKVVLARHANYIIGADMARSSLVMPVRCEAKTFTDPKGGYYTWAEIGLAALDHKYIRVGRFLP